MESNKENSSGKSTRNRNILNKVSSLKSNFAKLDLNSIKTGNLIKKNFNISFKQNIK